MRSGSGFGTAALVSLLLALGSGPVLAAESGGGPMQIDIRDDDSDQINAARVQAVQTAAELGVPVAAVAPPAAAANFQYPLQLTVNAVGLDEIAISNYTDRNPAAGQIQDFACGTRTYDGHNGIDNFLWPYSWNAMDRKEVRIVAALPGVIVDRHDGEFDRQCQLVGNPPANFVIVRHDNGLLGFYWHMKNGTVTKKAIGARVALGETLGLVGSSGFSSGPHLHFEVQTAAGTVIEPFTGLCNRGGTRWTHQPRTVDPAIVRIATHSIPPPSANNCDNPNPGYATRFLRGKTVYFAAYLRDQTPADKANVALLRPDGSVATSFLSSAPDTGIFPGSYWWSSYLLPADAPVGEWRVRVTYTTKTRYQSFIVQSAAPVATTITAATTAPVRAVTLNHPADFTVTLTNKTANRAVGCRLSLSRPIFADVTFRQLNLAGNPAGPLNYTFPIAPNGTMKARLTVTPRNGFRATAAEFPLVAKCLNSPTAAFSRANTMLTLTGP